MFVMFPAYVFVVFFNLFRTLVYVFLEFIVWKKMEEDGRRWKKMEEDGKKLEEVGRKKKFEKCQTKCLKLGTSVGVQKYYSDPVTTKKKSELSGNLTNRLARV